MVGAAAVGALCESVSQLCDVCDLGALSVVTSESEGGVCEGVSMSVCEGGLLKAGVQTHQRSKSAAAALLSTSTHTLTEQDESSHVHTDTAGTTSVLSLQCICYPCAWRSMDATCISLWRLSSALHIVFLPCLRLDDNAGETPPTSNVDTDTPQQASSKAEEVWARPLPDGHVSNLRCLSWFQAYAYPITDEVSDTHTHTLTHGTHTQAAAPSLRFLVALCLRLVLTRRVLPQALRMCISPCVMRLCVCVCVMRVCVCVYPHHTDMGDLVRGP